MLMTAIAILMTAFFFFVMVCLFAGLVSENTKNTLLRAQLASATDGVTALVSQIGTYQSLCRLLQQQNDQLRAQLRAHLDIQAPPVNVSAVPENEQLPSPGIDNTNADKPKPENARPGSIEGLLWKN